MLLRIILLLSFLLEREVILSKGSNALWVQAFSTVPRATTSAPRLRDGRFQTLERQPRETANSSSSLHAWQIPFGSARKIPTMGKDGLYHIRTEEEYRYVCEYQQCSMLSFRLLQKDGSIFLLTCLHRLLMEENCNSLIVLKVFSPWCKSCKALAPRFQALAKENANLPITWISLAYSKENKHLVRSELGVNAVPCVLLYAEDGELIDSFRCGPTKVGTILRPKLADLIDNHIDLSTRTLKISEVESKTQASDLQSSNREWNQQSVSTTGPLRMLARRFFESPRLDEAEPFNTTLPTSM